MFKIAAVCLVLSGMASLTYQVTWVRLLGLSLGSESASIATVLAAYFLGMALGSYGVGKLMRGRDQNFTLYARLELAIGTSGLLLLPVLLNLDALLAHFPTLAALIPVKFAVAVLLLLIPTLAMGATFPVMAAILVRQQNTMGTRISELYSLNTLGAVLGAALSGFVFIPGWGLDGAIYIAVSINFGVALTVWWFTRYSAITPLEPPYAALGEREQIGSVQSRGLQARTLFVLFATGFVAISCEVGWTKYLSIFTGTTIYGLSAILAIFLFGITLGSWAMRGIMQRLTNLERWLGTGLLVLAVSLLLTRVALTTVPVAFAAFNHLDLTDTAIHFFKYSLVFVLLVMPTVLFGALFPLNLQLYCGNVKGVRERIGKAYAVNTLAGILGALTAGFWAIPRFGTDAVLTFGALFLLCAAMLYYTEFPERRRRAAFASTIAVTFVLSLTFLPHLDYHKLIAAVGYDEDSDAGKKPEFLYLKESKTGVVSMVTYDGKLVKLQNNGLNESHYYINDLDNALLIESLLAFVPYVVHDQPRRAFVVGYGGGVTTRALTLTDIESIRVVELEPAIIEANRAAAGGEIPVLRDPRVRLSLGDGRNTLLLENEQYDIIIAQPSHPWLVRASNVFTQEFWSLAKTRLSDHGVFAQWINLFRMDAQTLRSLLAAFYSVFPHGFSFADTDTGNLILVGSPAEMKFRYERISKVIHHPPIASVLQQFDIDTPEALLWYFSMSRDEALAASSGAVANSDLNLIAETRLSRYARAPSIEDETIAFLHDHSNMNLLPYLDGQAVERLYAKVQYDFKWNDPNRYGLDLAQLQAIAPDTARALRHELYGRAYEYQEAVALYNKYDDWPAPVHARQAGIYADLGQFDAAYAALARIGDVATQRAAAAAVFFRLGEWEVLDKVEPMSPEETVWHALGAAERDLPYAAKMLLDVLEKSNLDVPQLRVLVRYAAAKGDFPMLQHWARELMSQVDDHIKRLHKATLAALDRQASEYALKLVALIERMNPEYDTRELHSEAARITNLNQ